MAARHMAEPAPKQRHPLAIILVTLIILSALGVGGYFAYKHFMVFNVTVNGQPVEVRKGDTVRTLLDAGVASPIPGNLLAVDGSVLDKGKGDLCSASINGKVADVDSPLVANAAIQIDDGADVTEDFETTEEIIPYDSNESDTSTAAYYNGSIHLLSDGIDGKREVKTGNLSGKRVEKTIAEPVNSGYQIFTAHPADRVIALTFDDGPWPESTDAILDILEQYDAKATFFTIGNQISSYPDQVQRANKLGCQVCTHTWDHASGSGQGVNITFMSADEQIDEVQKGYEAIANVLGTEPKHIMRAPGGNFYGDAVTNLWPYVDAEIGWDVDTEDWSRPGVDKIVEAILSVQPGQVILMHDGGGEREQTVEALSQALPKLVEQGYSFVTIDELLASETSE